MANTPSSLIKGCSDSSKSVKIDFKVRYNNPISEVSEMEVDDNIQIKSSKLAKKKITMIGNGHSFESDKRKTISEQSFNALECCQFSGTEHVCNSSIDDYSALDIGSKKPILSLKSYISRK